MDAVIRHNLELFRLAVQNSQDDSLGLIPRPQSPVTVNRERQAEDVSLTGEFSALVARAEKISEPMSNGTQNRWVEKQTESVRKGWL
ncbi:MAG: hypothetical protein JWN70_6462 [Planctomycetaceae bacterium]|nr:hypothetical protein [Planctomycetaceae bacterium]